MVKSSVSEEAVVERIRQVLRKQNRDLRVATPEQQKGLKLGRYYTVGPEAAVTDPDVELELLARDIHVRHGKSLKAKPFIAASPNPI
jgi:hypothetical protein